MKMEPTDSCIRIFRKHEGHKNALYSKEPNTVDLSDIKKAQIVHIFKVKTTKRGTFNFEDSFKNITLLASIIVIYFLEKLFYLTISLNFLPFW